MNLKLYTIENLGEGLTEGTWEHRILFNPETMTAKVVEVLWFPAYDPEEEIKETEQAVEDGELTREEADELIAKLKLYTPIERRVVYSETSKQDYNPEEYESSRIQEITLNKDLGYDEEDTLSFEENFVANFHRLFKWVDSPAESL